MKIKQHIILTIISFFYVVCIYSQNNDSIVYRVGYQFIKYDSLQNKSSTDSLILAISKTSSFFYSEITKQADEMIDKMINNLGSENNKNKSIVLQIPYKRYGTAQRIYKDFERNKIIVKDKIGTDEFYYEESIDIFKWSINTDTATIAGYLCQKAETNFRGRHFIAWFTNELAISNGPLKFGGLPGLIIKINDDKKIFTYTLCFFEKTSNILIPPMVTDKKTEVTRKQMANLKKAFFENPLAFINTQGNVQATITSGNSGTTKKYESFELE